ncbi:unnamed protein product [Cladocopium goreaui]|uniref:DNA ligase (Polydeoxyribonucleotide synthas e [NAD(+)]) n=1 Tax=Cladocopium goreaui TaxID=2562237 RepID=A0A9P1DN71_9DINO|nr:unnamed protein product [Cladocopium goreaui]
MGKLSVRCEFVEGSSNKFWECVQDGVSVTSSHGKIGGAPTQITKTFPSEAKAKNFFHSQLESKLKKGYTESGKAKTIGKGFGKALPKAASIMKVAMKAAVKKTAMKATKPSGGGKLKGKTLCFTGALAIKRSVATTLAKNHGAKVTGTVSKNTEPWLRKKTT